MLWFKTKTPRPHRLLVERLEDRLAPATVLPVNATHSFTSQLGAAVAGDILQIDPGAVIGTLGTNSGASAAATLAGATSITSDAFFAPGQVITISHSGDTTETDLIDAVSGPVAGVYTLSLHTPLADTHQSGSTLTAAAGLLGIDKGITIEGDPARPPSTLLTGTTLEYFTQNGTPAPDALIHLALTAVEGAASSNLNITGDTFNITSGALDAIAVTSGAALTINSDTFTFSGTATLENVIAVTSGAALTITSDRFTVSGTATLGNVVDGTTGAGAVTFASDTISVTGNLTSDGLEFTSTSGPIGITSLSFSVSGAIADDGIDVDTAGDVVISGTNTIHVGGAVTDSVLSVTTSANASVSNITATLSGNAGDGIQIGNSSSGNLAVSNVNITVDGNIGAVGDGAGIDLVAAGSGAIANLTVLIDHAANNGLYASFGGNLSVSGTQKVTVTGAVADDGMDLATSDGAITVSTSIGVSLGSTTEYGLYLKADEGTVVVTGAITVSVTGVVADDGVYFDSHSDMTLTGAFNVTLSGTAAAGLYLDAENGFLSSSGAITVSVAGQVATSGEGIYANGDAGASLAKITLTLDDGSLGYGAYLEAGEGNLTVSNVTGHITGAVSEYGIYLESDGNITSTNVTVHLSAVADYGIYSYAEDGNLAMTATTVSVGAAADDGAYLDAGSAETISALSVTLAATADYGVDAEDGTGNLSLYGVTVTATGALADDGVFLKNSGGNTAFSRATITLNGGVTDDALDADSPHGDLTISGNKITVKTSAATGIAAIAAGSLGLTGNTVALVGGTAVLLTGAAGNPQTIENNIFNTGGAGTGVAFSGGATVVALVQGNSFQSNLVGVAITGDATNAGDIDLGGGSLGSLGKNNFDGFNGVSDHYAITLNETNATSTVYALDNIFNVATPATAVQDQAEHGGTGVITL